MASCTSPGGEPDPEQEQSDEENEDPSGKKDPEPEEEGTPDEEEDPSENDDGDSESSTGDAEEEEDPTEGDSGTSEGDQSSEDDPGTDDEGSTEDDTTTEDPGEGGEDGECKVTAKWGTGKPFAAGTHVPNWEFEAVFDENGDGKIEGDERKGKKVSLEDVYCATPRNKFAVVTFSSLY